MELLLGCGHSRDRQTWTGGIEPPPWKGLVTCDSNPAVKPDVICDLSKLPLPFKSSSFSELHAYEVLEHFGTQGDWKFFFSQFDEFYRILEPKGYFFIKSPGTNNPWVWGDPGHTRYMGPQVYYFLDRSNYDKNKDKTPMTDYRPYFKSNWKTIASIEKPEVFMIILQKQ